LDVLPRRGDVDVPEKLAKLAELLRTAPFNGDGAALFRDAAKSLAELPEEIVTADRVMCLLFTTRFFVAFGGDIQTGLGLAEQASLLAAKLGDELLKAKALKMLGVAYLEGGAYPDTVSTLTKALDSATVAGDLFQEADILNNLGLAHQYAGHFGAAVPCYERAIELSMAAGSPPIIPAGAFANIALAYLQMRDFLPGIHAAERAIELLKDPANDHERTVRALAECYLTRLLLETRDVPGARRHALLARQHSQDAGSMAPLFADMALGLVDVYEPATRDVGLSRLQSAVNQSRRTAPSALRDALAMIVRGYEAAGQPNAALVYLHEVSQLNRDSRVRRVMEVHKRHVARVRLDLDRKAQAALDEQHRELRFQRLSIDALRECMLVLEKNTVAAELHDDDTGEHCYRVGALAKELAQRKGMDGEMCQLIDLSARLHDIGKLRVPDSILLKPGKFTPEERAIMQEHCSHGWELIGEGGLAQLFVAQEIALNHHERWDGNGYPNRRSGNMIPLAARITSLADVFDALTHRRCYKEAWTVEDALREIASLRGRHFDPELTDIFLELIPELQKRHGSLDTYLGAEARKNDFIADRVRVAHELKNDLETFDARR
jgi:HD-GYP domain-containing protein (c-di-GMP phosphodiesterase class II)